MKVKALADHRYGERSIEKGETYELDDELATRAISEGFVADARPKPQPAPEESKTSPAPKSRRARKTK